MIKTIEIENGVEREVRIMRVNSWPKSPGHYKLSIELQDVNTGRIGVFNYTTPHMSFIDDLSEIEDYIERQEVVYNHMYPEIEEQVIGWLYFLED